MCNGFRNKQVSSGMPSQHLSATQYNLGMIVWYNVM